MRLSVDCTWLRYESWRICFLTSMHRAIRGNGFDIASTFVVIKTTRCNFQCHQINVIVRPSICYDTIKGLQSAGTSDKKKQPITVNCIFLYVHRVGRWHITLMQLFINNSWFLPEWTDKYVQADPYSILSILGTIIALTCIKQHIVQLCDVYNGQECFSIHLSRYLIKWLKLYLPSISGVRAPKLGGEI